MEETNSDRTAKILAAALAFLQKDGPYLCFECGTELQLAKGHILTCGVVCPHCGTNYSWSQWSEYRDNWRYDEDNAALLGYSGNHENLYIPPCCSRIGSNAFSNSDVCNVYIPDNVCCIESGAFSNCRSLTHVTLPDGLQRIETKTFWGCEQLTNVTIPPTVKYIGKYAFAGCVKLKEIRLPEGVLMLDTGAFSGSGLTQIHLNGCCIVGNDVFAGCKNLQQVKLKGVQKLGERAFTQCSSLHSVEMSGDLLTIGSNAFEGCTSMRDICIPDSVFEIGNQAFAKDHQIYAMLPRSLEEQITNFHILRPGKKYIFEKSSKIQYY